eukprot:700169_1
MSQSYQPQLNHQQYSQSHSTLNQFNEQQPTQPQLNHSQLDWIQLNELQSSAAQSSEPQSSEPQSNQSQVNHSQLNRSQLNELHSNQQQSNQQQLNQPQLDQPQSSQPQLDQLQSNQPQLNKLESDKLPYYDSTQSASSAHLSQCNQSSHPNLPPPTEQFPSENIPNPPISITSDNSIVELGPESLARLKDPLSLNRKPQLRRVRPSPKLLLKFSHVSTERFVNYSFHNSSVGSESRQSDIPQLSQTVVSQSSSSSAVTVDSQSEVSSLSPL